MSEEYFGDAIERLEWDERKEEETPLKKWRQMTRRTALTGGAAGIAAMVLEACGSSNKSGSTGTGTASAASSSSAASSIFGVSGGYKFTLVNHVTTNPFFTPTQNGAADACKLLGCSYQWTGSQNSNVGEMVSAFNSAVSAKVDGIAIPLVSLTAFNSPTTQALAAGIPVLSYNADAAGNARLAYIGQDLYVSGQEMGKKIAGLVGSSGDVALFIATPGSLNIQPRIDGAQAALKGTGITTHVVATGAALTQELSTVEAYVSSHQSYKGFFAVDGGSTQSVGQAIQKYGLKGKVKGGGYDLTPVTQQTLAAGYMQFTIDQQPYLQGFLPILQLYMYRASQTLTGIADVNTGLKFLDATSVAPYNSTKSRYEGTSSSAGVTKA